MGLYPMDCPRCNKHFMWFSGDNNYAQLCSDCLKPSAPPDDSFEARAKWAYQNHKWDINRTIMQTEIWYQGALWAAKEKDAEIEDLRSKNVSNYIEIAELRAQLEIAELGRKLAHDEAARRLNEWSKCQGQLDIAKEALEDSCACTYRTQGKISWDPKLEIDEKCISCQALEKLKPTTNTSSY